MREPANTPSDREVCADIYVNDTHTPLQILARKQDADYQGRDDLLLLTPRRTLALALEGWLAITSQTDY